jgi:O6-methylguanine-DNA--protein-cysteine methyltransferase
MLNNASVTLAYDSAVIHEVSLCVYQVVLEIQQQQPEFLTEKYRNVSWSEARNRSTLLMKLQQGMSKTRNRTALIQTVQKFMQILLIPGYFELPNFRQLIEKIDALILPPRESNSLANTNSAQLNVTSNSRQSAQLTPYPQGIAILLLDAENLQLDVNTEKFLAGICAYPIQIKVAFANWRSMGKQDIEFHGRGYELIHVPSGKDSADVKMATVGSSIFVHYPTAKEVFVCSSDGVLSHLSTTLQTHGLTVYLVRKKGDNITVQNSKTSQVQTYSLKPVPEIPKFDDFLLQLKELIQSEQNRTQRQWIKLAKISHAFQEQYNLSISQVVSHHLPGKRARDIFIENPATFVVHQVSEQGELYISLFEHSTAPVRDVKEPSPESEAKTKTKKLAEIKSCEELENILLQMIESTTQQSPGSYVPITMLGTQFQRKYGQSVTKVLKKLQLNVKFSKFLQTCKRFELKQTEKGWSVAVRTEA